MNICVHLPISISLDIYITCNSFSPILYDSKSEQKFDLLTIIAASLFRALYLIEVEFNFSFTYEEWQRNVIIHNTNLHCISVFIISSSYENLIFLCFIKILPLIQTEHRDVRAIINKYSIQELFEVYSLCCEMLFNVDYYQNNYFIKTKKSNKVSRDKMFSKQW